MSLLPPFRSALWLFARYAAAGGRRGGTGAAVNRTAALALRDQARFGDLAQRQALAQPTGLLSGDEDQAAIARQGLALREELAKRDFQARFGRDTYLSRAARVTGTPQSRAKVAREVEKLLAERRRGADPQRLFGRGLVAGDSPTDGQPALLAGGEFVPSRPGDRLRRPGQPLRGRRGGRQRQPLPRQWTGRGVGGTPAFGLPAAGRRATLTLATSASAGHATDADVEKRLPDLSFCGTEGRRRATGKKQRPLHARRSRA